MAYTTPWDEAFPPDTQPAKLLGQDIRDFKTDVRERLGTFYSGALADRPTPEAIWAGLLYFATDTQTIYRWDGSGWEVYGSLQRGVGSPALDGTEFSFVGDWGGTPTKLGVSGTDGGGTFAFSTPADGSGNPSVLLTFKNPWPSSCVAVVCSLEGFPTTNMYWLVQDMSSTSVRFIIGTGGSVPAGLYGISFIVLGL